MSAFVAIAEGQSACLVAASLEFARDEYPELDVSGYLGQYQSILDGFQLFRSVRNVPDDGDPQELVGVLNEYFFSDLGFTGSTDNYYDPRNSYLNDVLDRRTGIPITLSVLYQGLAASANLDLCGVNLPGHFMLAYPPRLGRRQYVDVFHGGASYDWYQCVEHLSQMGAERSLTEHDFPPMSHRDILARMLRNLKGIYSSCDICRTLRVQQRLVQLQPNEPAELRDLGLLYFRAGQPMLAWRTLEDLVKRFPKLGETEFIRDSLKQAVREAVLLN
jgi:regulator of sirC expression with transglutaminase-like and TPR domain